MGSWLTDAFVDFLKLLFPFAGQTFAPEDGWAATLLGVWLPPLDGIGPTLAFTAALGLVIATWYALPAITVAITAGDARAIAQAFAGLVAAAAAGPLAVWTATTLGPEVIATASGLVGDTMVSLFDPASLDAAGSVLTVLMIVIGTITYLLAGTIGGYAFLLVAALAPIAAASLVFKSGVAGFGKWLAWFFTLLLAPVWVAIAFAIAAHLSTSQDAVVLADLARTVGLLLAAAAPFTMLAVISKVIPAGGHAETATRVGAGSSAATPAVQIATRATMR